MKKKDKQNLWQKKIGELEELSEKKKMELVKTGLNINETKDKNLPKKLKREIATIKTIIGEIKFREVVGKDKKKEVHK